MKCEGGIQLTLESTAKAEGGPREATTPSISTCLPANLGSFLGTGTRQEGSDQLRNTGPLYHVMAMAGDQRLVIIA